MSVTQTILRRFLLGVPGKPVIFSVRHGESITNVNRTMHKRVADPAVWLTERGHGQAQAASAFLVEKFRNMPLDERPKKVRIMRSFYRRAVQTAEHIEGALRAANLGMEISVKEDPRLRELEFGYAGALTERLPYVDWYTNILRFQGFKYLATRFGGESPAWMEPRVRSLLDAMWRDLAENGITHFIVVNHGLTSRVLTKARYGYGNAWWNAEPNPDNCAIRLLAERDEGYVFPNVQGQWDAGWQPETAEEGASALNPGGLFFSMEEMEELIALQSRFPQVMEQLNTLFQVEPKLPATEAIRRVKTGLGAEGSPQLQAG